MSTDEKVVLTGQINAVRQVFDSQHNEYQWSMYSDLDFTNLVGARNHLVHDPFPTDLRMPLCLSELHEVLAATEDAFNEKLRTLL